MTTLNTRTDSMSSVHGLILTPEGPIEGCLIWEACHIKAVLAEAPTADQHERQGALIVPGFIDLHVHGAAGRDFMDAADSASTIAALHARHGTCAMLATTMTAPIEAIRCALASIAAAMQKQSNRRACQRDPSELRPFSQADQPAEPFEAEILGVHLEGPYLSAQKLGAQPAHTKTASLEEIMSLHAIAALRIITLAPENEAHLRLIVALRDAGFAVQLGHSEASYALAKQAFGCGARGVTHLFNAMSGFHHRSPGLVGASLAHAEFAEIIPDLLHVHPGAMLAAYRAIPGLYAVTDATAATGMPDGSYRLGEQTVQRCLGSVRLPDGSLAGSALTMDQAFRNLVSIGLSLNQASEMLSARPAQMLELTDRGRISKDYRADFVVLDRDNLLVQQVVIGGRVLNLRHSALSQSSP